MAQLQAKNGSRPAAGKLWTMSFVVRCGCTMNSGILAFSTPYNVALVAARNAVSTGRRVGHTSCP
eukprot:866987-Rhodomonas_salina.4